jgi:hypothetical protein
MQSKVVLKCQDRRNATCVEMELETINPNHTTVLSLVWNNIPVHLKQGFTLILCRERCQTDS